MVCVIIMYKIHKIVNIESSYKFAKFFYEEHLKLCSNFTVFLDGGLGSGKTLLTQEWLRLFGVGSIVKSPTYTFLEEYNMGLLQIQKFAHFDFYRFVNNRDFFFHGFNEVAEDENYSCFVEWRSKIDKIGQDCFSGKKFYINILHGKGVGIRTIKVKI